LGGEAQKITFHLGGDSPAPQRPEPPGIGVWVLTAAGATATASVFGVYGYVAAVAIGHLLWPQRLVAP
jgi:hypothetical protein